MLICTKFSILWGFQKCFIDKTEIIEIIAKMNKFYAQEQYFKKIHNKSKIKVSHQTRYQMKAKKPQTSDG